MNDRHIDFRLLFEQSPDVLLVLLPDAPRFTMVAATRTRWRATHSTAETLGSGLFEVFPDNPNDSAATGTSNLRASLERVLKTREPDTMPVQKYDIRRPDGSFETRYWSPKNLPVLSPAGEVQYILHRVEDVTDLVRASEVGEELRDRQRAMEREVIQRSHELAAALNEVRSANAKLAELDVAKTDFFNNISHEFRTPLTLVLGPLEDELAESDTLLPLERRERLTVAHRNALRLLKLVNGLLDFARIEAGRARAHFQPTDLSQLTAELVSNFESALQRAGLSSTIDCPPLPQPFHVDREMWEKIVLNLISNAFKHTFTGGITVRLVWLGETAELCVEDTGIGIAADEIPHLFERFHRVSGAASRTHEGTGIGLSLVQELVKLHAGSIRVESEIGRGSRFIVTVKAGTTHLPPDQIGASEPDTARRRESQVYEQEALSWLLPEPSIEPGTRSRETTPSRPRILLADDNADMRRYIERLLEPYYELVSVTDGQAAFEAALSRQPDLVLSDVMMPRLDGFGLLKALRAHEHTRQLPIILLSARAGDEAAVAGLDGGADDYLVKPFSARELLARVRSHLDLARQRRDDPLTGLAKRALFCERLTRLLAHPPAARLAVTVFDLAHLAVINDSFGRPTGDRLLHFVGARLKEHFPDTELLAHLGGGTFVCVSTADASARDGQEFIRQIFGAPFYVNGHEILAEVRSGVAFHPEDGRDSNALVQNAEAALKVAKASGERYLHHRVEMNAELARRVDMEHRLRSALDDGQFRLYYQPKVALASGRVVGVEALLRWQDPERGLIAPAEFLPLLESGGLMPATGAWVLQQAVEDCHDWRNKGLPPLRVAVNISPSELRRRNVAGEILDVVDDLVGESDWGIDIEITEGALAGDASSCIHALRLLRAAGVKIAIDDFGTGFSSLGRLSELPIDTLKIDRTFTLRLPADPKSCTLVSTIIGLAHAFGMTTIAEGVETLAQLNHLGAAGCDESQGFFHSRPLPKSEFEIWLRRLNRLPVHNRVIYNPP